MKWKWVLIVLSGLFLFAGIAAGQDSGDGGEPARAASLIDELQQWAERVEAGDSPESSQREGADLLERLNRLFASMANRIAGEGNREFAMASLEAASRVSEICARLLEIPDFEPFPFLLEAVARAGESASGVILAASEMAEQRNDTGLAQATAFSANNFQQMNLQILDRAASGEMASSVIRSIASETKVAAAAERIAKVGKNNGNPGLTEDANGLVSGNAHFIQQVRSSISAFETPEGIGALASLVESSSRAFGVLAETPGMESAALRTGQSLLGEIQGLQADAQRAMETNENPEAVAAYADLVARIQEVSSTLSGLVAALEETVNPAVPADRGTERDESWKEPATDDKGPLVGDTEPASPI